MEPLWDHAPRVANASAGTNRGALAFTLACYPSLCVGEAFLRDRPGECRRQPNPCSARPVRRFPPMCLTAGNIGLGRGATVLLISRSAWQATITMFRRVSGSVPLPAVPMPGPSSRALPCPQGGSCDALAVDTPLRSSCTALQAWRRSPKRNHDVRIDKFRFGSLQEGVLTTASVSASLPAADTEKPSGRAHMPIPGYGSKARQIVRT